MLLSTYATQHVLAHYVNVILIMNNIAECFTRTQQKMELPKDYDQSKIRLRFLFVLSKINIPKNEIKNMVRIIKWLVYLKFLTLMM